MSAQTIYRLKDFRERRELSEALNDPYMEACKKLEKIWSLDLTYLDSRSRTKLIEEVILCKLVFAIAETEEVKLALQELADTHGCSLTEMVKRLTKEELREIVQRVAPDALLVHLH